MISNNCKKVENANGEMEMETGPNWLCWFYIIFFLIVPGIYFTVNNYSKSLKSVIITIIMINKCMIF